MERSTQHHFGSHVALLIGLITAVAATVAVMAFVSDDEPVLAGSSDEWDEIIGM